MQIFETISKYTIYDIDYRDDVSFYMRVLEKIMKKKTMREKNVK